MYNQDATSVGNGLLNYGDNQDWSWAANFESAVTSAHNDGTQQIVQHLIEQVLVGTLTGDEALVVGSLVLSGVELLGRESRLLCPI